MCFRKISARGHKCACSKYILGGEGIHRYQGESSKKLCFSWIAEPEVVQTNSTSTEIYKKEKKKVW